MLSVTNYNVNAVSKINDVDVIYFSSSLSLDNNTGMSFSKSIVNKELYFDNKAACDADNEEFEIYVTDLVNTLSSGETTQNVEMSKNE